MIHGDALEEMGKMEDGSVDLVLADPPYGEFPLINDAIDEALRVSTGSVLFFMYSEDLPRLRLQPERVVFWMKPVSTKNTTKQYSRFVEVIACYRVQFVRQLHWTNRRGIFTDTLDEIPEHPFAKPESLIRKLLLNHCPTGGLVLDPFAGSGTTERVAAELGLGCLSIETNPRWAKRESA